MFIFHSESASPGTGREPLATSLDETAHSRCDPINKPQGYIPDILPDEHIKRHTPRNHGVWRGRAYSDGHRRPWPHWILGFLATYISDCGGLLRVREAGETGKIPGKQHHWELQKTLVDRCGHHEVLDF